MVVEDIEIEKVSTNGKGISKKIALASGYGEFMERLQNSALYYKKYGLMNELIFECPDQKIYS